MPTLSVRKTCCLTRAAIAAALVLLAMPAFATDNGTISFTGRIVNPTCALNGVNLPKAARAPHLWECGAARAGFANDLTRAVVRTEAIEATSPYRLLRYFYQYTQASGPHATSDPMLITLEYP